MQHLDRLIGQDNHLYRERRSIADAYAFVMVRWTDRLPKTWRDYPNITRFQTCMEQDPTVQDVLRRSTA